ncbi:hypothetical protein [Enterovibrio baiacu]|uniref:hypothetical protein n=1 Tax=Enterovibrio baiacu TaxID=2491023 RepID=UPI0010130066|nr:hypothetical protein [Enterovibrio baiacu]MBE1275091.1 hypothetical protein [Enterovibrio baiacu]
MTILSASQFQKLHSRMFKAILSKLIDLGCFDDALSFALNIAWSSENDLINITMFNRSNEDIISSASITSEELMKLGTNTRSHIGALCGALANEYAQEAKDATTYEYDLYTSMEREKEYLATAEPVTVSEPVELPNIHEHSYWCLDTHNPLYGRHDGYVNREEGIFYTNEGLMIDMETYTIIEEDEPAYFMIDGVPYSYETRQPLTEDKSFDCIKS